MAEKDLYQQTISKSNQIRKFTNSMETKLHILERPVLFLQVIFSPNPKHPTYRENSLQKKACSCDKFGDVITPSTPQQKFDTVDKQFISLTRQYYYQ